MQLKMTEKALIALASLVLAFYSGMATSKGSLQLQDLPLNCSVDVSSTYPST